MVKTPDYFSGKTILITGAASGIGAATARIFAREGANVLCADLDAVGARRIADEVSRFGGAALPFAMDVTRREDAGEMVRLGKREFGKIHFLFNSAGSIVRRCKFLEIDDDTWDKTFDLNVKGTFYCTQAVLPEMLAGGGGVIVNMASMAHLNGAPGIAVHYGAAKGAVTTMTLGIAREFADRGIRCLSISAGYVDTPFQRSASEELWERMSASIPMGRMGTPEEIGELVLFMCSDACPFMTGDTVKVNGGAGFR